MMSVNATSRALWPIDMRHLGMTNEPPSVDDLQSICGIQNTLQQELSKLDEELEILESKRSSLLAKRTETVIHIDTCKKIRSPIRSLPIDILSEIFTQCLRNDIDDNHEQGIWREKRVLQAPLLLLQICSTWRSAALQLPHLWSVLVFPVGDWVTSKGAKVENYLRQGKEWCKRAKGTPLSIDFLAHPILGAQSSIQLLVSEIIGSNMGSIKHLRFHSRHLVDRLNHLLPGNFNQLECLILRDESTSSATHLSLFHDSPNLRRVSLSNVLTQDTMSYLPLQRAKLTHLVILNFIGLSHWTTLLSECTSLIYGVFYLDNKGGDSFPPFADAKSILPQLADLTLIFLNKLDPRAIQNLILPGLKSLRLGSSARDTQTVWFEEESHHFYNQIHGLTQLSIMNNWNPSVDTILSILRATPLLKVLDLNLNLDHAELFEALLKPENGVVIDLDVLSLRYSSWNFSVPLFCAFAKSSLLLHKRGDSANSSLIGQKEVIFIVSAMEKLMLKEVESVLAQEIEKVAFKLSLFTTDARAHWKDRLKDHCYTWDDGLI